MDARPAHVFFKGACDRSRFKIRLTINFFFCMVLDKYGMQLFPLRESSLWEDSFSNLVISISIFRRRKKIYDAKCPWVKLKPEDSIADAWIPPYFISPEKFIGIFWQKKTCWKLCVASAWVEIFGCAWNKSSSTKSLWNAARSHDESEVCDAVTFYILNMVSQLKKM